MSLNEIARECLEITESKGFHPIKNIGDLERYRFYLATKIALIHSEATEMLEAIRKNDFNNMVEECIDVIIRTLEYLACLKDVDIDAELKKKMEYNKNRPYRHGNKLL